MLIINVYCLYCLSIVSYHLIIMTSPGSFWPSGVNTILSFLSYFCY